MSTVNYDLDTSGGLMPEIRALIRPPDEDISIQKPKKSQHPYYKRPGKGHNRDCCDACQEGGDLICCDRCPASFHLGCHDPPLEEKDIPIGQWHCRECRAATGEDLAVAGSSKQPVATTTPPTPSTGSTEKKTEVIVEKKTRLLRNKRSLSGPHKKADKDNGTAQKPGKEKSVPPESEEKDSSATKVVEKPKEPENLKPMDILIKAAKIMNPRQFELPRELRIPCNFPGTDREIQRGASSGTGAGAVTMENGTVPLPVRVCAGCGLSCRTGPLLQCDYCPLLFHLDCTEPPLAALPAARWMCPCHVQHHTDSLMLTSVSAVERVALWDRWTAPVDQHAIKLDFIRHANKTRPSFRVKIKVPGGHGRVRVPEMVRYHYRPEHRVPLLPSRREFVRCMKVRKDGRSYEEPEEYEYDASRKHIICMNFDCPKYMTKGGTCMHDSDGYDSSEERKEIADEDLRIIEDSERAEPPQSSLKRDFVLSETPSVEETPKLTKRIKTGEDVGELEDLIRDYGLADSKETKEALCAVEEQLKKLDSRLIKLLAFQRLQQILDAERGKRPPLRRAPRPADAAPLDRTLAGLVCKSINRAGLAKYGFRHVPLPSELLSEADIRRINREVVGAMQDGNDAPRTLHFITPEEPPEVGPAPASPGHSLSDVPVKATLCPVERPARIGLGDGLGRPVAMRLSRLSIGSSSTCDVNLSAHGKCNFVSDLHAVIFYDEVSHHFELINYSEFGTCVNGQLYSCDLSDRWTSGGDPAVEAEKEREAGVKEIANRRRGIVKMDHSARPRLPSTPSCDCGTVPRDSLVGGWEGTALLCHGAMLQFGCIMFVFSITDVILQDNGRVFVTPVEKVDT